MKQRKAAAKSEDKNIAEQLIENAQNLKPRIQSKGLKAILIAIKIAVVAAVVLHERLQLGISPSVLFAVSFALLVVLVAFFLPPLPQSQSYHAFADQRNLCCGAVPNSLDVLSNIPFLVVGAFGCAAVLREDRPLFFYTYWEKMAWLVLFGAVALVSVGSAYYHWKPNNKTLVWDRLPMTIGFMAIFAVQLQERLLHDTVSADDLALGEAAGAGWLAKWGLIVCVPAGLWSIYYWDKYDDLRPYLVVQFYPLLVIPQLMWVYPAAYTHTSYVGVALLFYFAAKITEVWDKPIYKLTGRLVSGHTLKHLLAAFAIEALVRMVKLRSPINTKMEFTIEY